MSLAKGLIRMDIRHDSMKNNNKEFERYFISFNSILIIILGPRALLNRGCWLPMNQGHSILVPSDWRECTGWGNYAIYPGQW